VGVSVCGCEWVLTFGEDILAFSGLANVLATFEKNWAISSNLLVTLLIYFRMSTWVAKNGWSSPL
jgi:hypothetical protein